MLGIAEQMKEMRSKLAGLAPEKRAAFVKLLKEQGIDLSQEMIILPRQAGAGPLPLSFAQERLWFLDRMEPGTSLYNMPFILKLSGPLSFEALERGLQEIVRRHEILRTTYTLAGDQPSQVVHATAGVRIRRVDLRDLPEAERAARAEELAREEALKPFDLARGPMLRALLVQTDDQEHLAALTLHHIAADGWSVGVLVRELAVLYEAFSEGREPDLPELQFQCADYAIWQREWMQGEVRARQLAYWREQLRDSPPPLQLPTDRPRPPVQRFRGTYQTFALGPEVASGLEALARGEGTTLFMVLLAALDTLIHRYSGDRDLVVGTGFANRQQPGTEDLIGFLVNTVIIRTRFEGDPSFRDLVRTVRGASVEAYEHDLPFDVLVQELQPKRDLSVGSPFVQTVFVHMNVPSRLNLSGLTLTALPPVSNTTKFDLVLTTFEGGGVLNGRFEYNTDLFDDATISLLIEHFQTLLAGIVANPDRALSELPLMAPAEREKVLRTWNDTRRELPRNRPVHRLIEAQAAAEPQMTAVVFEGESLTYGELTARANKLARYLRGLGVGPDTSVGLCVDRSCDMIVALLAVLKAGGAYLPLDPTFPQERAAFMLADAGVRILVAQERLAPALAGFDGEVVFLDSGDPFLEAQPEEDLDGATDLASLAYVIYTSGSTGRPKGVGVTHGALLNYLHAIEERFGFEPGASFATVSTIAADLGNTMIFPCLCLGGVLHVVSRERLASSERLAEYLEEKGIDYLKIVPSHLAALLRVAREPARLLPRKRLVLGGEASDWEWVRGLAQAAPGCSIVNHYGPTESTIGVSTFDPAAGPDVDRPALPLGRPLANVRLYVLDRKLEPVPAGVIGEVHIAGAGLARGYLNRPAATAEAFLPDPFSGEPGGRMYRTGDLVRHLPSGDLEFIGRADHQVKIRGNRVELKEIEATLGEHPAVSSSVVLAQKRGSDQRLVAYVVPDERRAPGVCRMLREERLLEGKRAYKLPNGLTVVHQNKNETDYLFEEIFERRAYFKHGIELKDGDVVFDVGSNIGMFTVYVQATCKNARIYSFEPTPRIYNLMKTNAELQGVRGAQINCAVSDEPGRATFRFYPRFSIMSGLYADAQDDKHYVRSYMENQERAGLAPQMSALLAESDRLLDERLHIEEFEVELKTLSQAIAELGVDRIDLLKINVEKNEHKVIAGIRDEDWPKIRQISVEVHDAEGRLQSMLEAFRARGFDALGWQDPLLAGTDLYYIYARRPDVRPSGAADSAAASAAITAPITAAGPGLDDEQVSYWQTVFDGVYSQTAAGSDPSFNHVGWTSSYTGEPIPEAEMREWADGSVDRILALQPDRVLEIGCGTGLLLFRVAPTCEEYWGTDLSEQVLDSLERRIAHHEGTLAPVRLLRREAADFSGLEGEFFKVVVLNSVSQYFPSADYLLAVLEPAVARVQDGGSVFLGDVRNLSLLEAFHTSIEMARAEDGLERDALRQRVARRVAQEQELLVDPGFFARLKQRLPRISRVEVQLRRGRARNEMSCYRYDVVLHVGEPTAKVEIEWRDWRKEGLSLDGLRSLLAEGPEQLGITSVTNARVRNDSRTLEWLVNQDQPGTVGEFRPLLAAGDPGVDPEDLWALAAELPYDVEICWSRSAGEGSFDVLFRRRGTPQPPAEFPLVREADEMRPWSSYTNDPLQVRAGRSLGPELRSFLRDKLPEYMVPAEIVLLDRLPLNANGKLDLRALPEPREERAEEVATVEQAAPAEDHEVKEAIAAVWRDVLGIDKVGYDDNFFDLGGHSLLIVDVNAQLVEKGICSEELSVVDMFEFPTINSLVKRLRASEPQAPSAEQTDDRAAKRREALSRRAEARQ